MYFPKDHDISLKKPAADHWFPVVWSLHGEEDWAYVGLWDMCWDWLSPFQYSKGDLWKSNPVKVGCWMMKLTASNHVDSDFKKWGLLDHDLDHDTILTCTGASQSFSSELSHTVPTWCCPLVEDPVSIGYTAPKHPLSPPKKEARKPDHHGSYPQMMLQWSEVCRCNQSGVG